MNKRCLQCEKEIPTNNKFCNKSCAAKYNNSRRIVSNETKQKISKTLSTKIDIDQLCLDHINGKTNLELSEKFNITISTVKKYLHLRGYVKQRNTEDTLCDIHNIKYSKRKDGSYSCVQCSTNLKQTRRQKLKIKAVEYLGGCCKICLYKKSLSALEFHHLNPNEKDFTIASMGSKKWETIKTELNKCILLCANCHREEHDRLRNIL